MGEVPIGISRGGDPLIYLRHVHALPRDVFLREETQHLPWCMTAAHRHHEASARGHGCPRLGGDEGGRSGRYRVAVG
jgi:hypothetical protein